MCPGLDHEGTILKDRKYVRENAVVPPWTVILVDEYQDVNPAQAAFVHALLMPRVSARPSTSARLTAGRAACGTELPGAVEACQCFPRYRYEQQDGVQGDLLDETRGLERIDNITCTALHVFRVRYDGNTISKDAIFNYVYGVLHSPEYRERFANDLTKELPRVPMAQDFHGFAEAGRQLADLHLNYGTCEEYRLSVEGTNCGELRSEHYRLGTRAMRFADEERTTLIVNDYERS